MLNIESSPRYVAYKEVAQTLGISISKCKIDYKVSRRINRLGALLNFLHNNICFTDSTGKCDKSLIVYNGGGIITIKLVNDVTDEVLDVWYFRRSKRDLSVSDELETYFISSKLCEKSYLNTKTIYNYLNTTAKICFKQAIHWLHQIIPDPEVKFYSIKRFLKKTYFYYGDYMCFLKHASWFKIKISQI